MKEYKIPNEFYFRLHHVRPRFKEDPETVLLRMVTEIAKLIGLPKNLFNKRLNEAIKAFPGNEIKTDKTINNWRTEISTLFSFYFAGTDEVFIGTRTKELAEKQDLVEFFKKFLFLFQYPGGHIKEKEILEMIKAGIHFKPAKYIINVLLEGKNYSNSQVYLSREEVCHCIFNDLRCTRDQDPPLSTWKRILLNRKEKVKYIKKGDVVRYAKDILDYMVIANILIKQSNKYYINELEKEAIEIFAKDDNWFLGYDKMIKNKTGNLEQIKKNNVHWFEYINKILNEDKFKTNLINLISTDSNGNPNIRHIIEELLNKNLNDIDTKEIGDAGESLIYSHECQRIKNEDREDLIHLIKKIPTQFAIGYDIQSVENDEKKRYIEVKTTISSKPLNFNKIHMTTNEWVVAESVRDRYYIYRLSLTKSKIKLFIIQDPVTLYKKDIIKMVPRDGADVQFDQNAGKEEDLLTWEN